MVKKTYTEGSRFSLHLGCQGLPGLDMLNSYNKYIISIFKVLRNRSNYINNIYYIIMLYTLITSERVYSHEIQKISPNFLK